MAVTVEALELRTGDTSLTAQQVKAQVNLIQDVLRTVMKDGTHYGTIPGTNKPTLFKAGAEKILSTFRIAIEPEVLDLSTLDEVRFRVLARATSQASGAFLGSGVGECSSSEEKYNWRAAVCEEEFAGTPEDRRRSVWKKANTPYQIKQVRTNPADVANTVLKMAKKRAQIDACLTVTAASDVFAQDLEDLSPELREAVAGEEQHQAAAPVQPPQRRPQPSSAGVGGASLISESQARRMFAIGKQAGWPSEDYRAVLVRHGIPDGDDRKVPKSKYEAICRELENGASAS